MSMSASATWLTITNSMAIARTKVLPAMCAAFHQPSFSHCFHQRSTTSAQTTTGKASTCKSRSSTSCNMVRTSTTSEISTPRKPTRVIRSLSSEGAMIMPTVTDEMSTIGPKMGPI